MFRSFSSVDAFPPDFSSVPIHLGIGNYDGFHCGHRAVFRKAKAAAEADGGLVGALTFQPHPEVFFRGNGAVRQIFPRERKDAFFADAGLDFAVHETFSREFAEISAAAFPDFLLKKIPSLRGIYVGDNFRFGAGRGGDTALLEKLFRERGVSVIVVEPETYAGTRISSSRIRRALEAGEIRAADAMLSEPYACCGNVVSGNRLGRTIGFPTLNLEWAPELRPKFGVYVVRVRVPATGRIFRGVANYGVRPTVEKNAQPLLETFLLDAPAGTDVPVYGDFIRVEWLDFLRSETRFEDIGALRRQLERDKSAALASDVFFKMP